jgi:hypothetical protein
VFLAAARPIFRASTNRTITPSPLLQTIGREGETETSYALRVGEGDRPVESFDESTDVPGPLILAWAAESETPFRPARIVVVGDSVFASNGWIDRGANRDFFLGAVEWLVAGESSLGIAPVIDLDRGVVLTRGQDRLFVALFLVGLPLFALALGAAVWRSRRR